MRCASGIAVLIRDFLDRTRDGEDLPDDAPPDANSKWSSSSPRPTPPEQIAQHLNLSRKTVERRCGNVLAKLGMRDRVALTRYAIKRALVES